MAPLDWLFKRNLETPVGEQLQGTILPLAHFGRYIAPCDAEGIFTPAARCLEQALQQVYGPVSVSDPQDTGNLVLCYSFQGREIKASYRAQPYFHDGIEDRRSFLQRPNFYPAVLGLEAERIDLQKAGALYNLLLFEGVRGKVFLLSRCWTDSSFPVRHMRGETLLREGEELLLEMRVSPKRNYLHIIVGERLLWEGHPGREP